MTDDVATQAFSYGFVFSVEAVGCPVGVWVRRTRADPGFVGRLFTKPRNGLVTDVRLITLMEWSSVTNRNCAGSATRDNSLPSRTACAACDPWPAEGLAMTMLRWVLIRHRHRVWGVKDVATHRSTISGGDLSTVSGLIGQRSCGNVVVRGVNDVVTQDTVILTVCDVSGHRNSRTYGFRRFGYSYFWGLVRCGL